MPAAETPSPVRDRTGLRRHIHRPQKPRHLCLSLRASHGQGHAAGPGCRSEEPLVPGNPSQPQVSVCRQRDRRLGGQTHRRRQRLCHRRLDGQADPAQSISPRKAPGPATWSSIAPAARCWWPTTAAAAWPPCRSPPMANSTPLRRSSNTRATASTRRARKGPHAHSINVDPANRFAVAADLGLDKVLVYRLDAEHGKLAPNDPPSVVGEARQRTAALRLSPDRQIRLRHQRNSLHRDGLRLRRRPGRAERDCKPFRRLPEGVKLAPEYSTAEVQVHPSGKFVYGSNRGHDSIAVFAVDAVDRQADLGRQHADRRQNAPRLRHRPQRPLPAGRQSGFAHDHGLSHRRTDRQTVGRWAEAGSRLAGVREIHGRVVADYGRVVADRGGPFVANQSPQPIARAAHAPRADRDRLLEHARRRCGSAGRATRDCRRAGDRGPVPFEPSARRAADQKCAVSVHVRRAQPARYARHEARGSGRVPRRVPPHRHDHAPGVHVCEHLPQLAQRMNRFALVRSMTCNPGFGDHRTGRARTAGRHRRIARRRHAGRLAPRLALLGCRRRIHAPSRDGLPSRVVLPGDVVDPGTGLYPGQNAGLLGAKFDPFRLRGNPADPKYHVDDSLRLPAGMTIERMASKRTLLAEFNRQQTALASAVEASPYENSQREAFGVLTSGRLAQALAIDERAPGRARTLRQPHVRPNDALGAAADRGRRADRAGQRQLPGAVGYPLQQLRRAPRPAAAVRRRAVGPDRRHGGQRAVGRNAAGRDGRVRPHAQARDTQRHDSLFHQSRPRPLDELLHRPVRWRRRAGRPGDRPQRRALPPIPSPSPIATATSPPRSTRRWASTRPPKSPTPKVAPCGSTPAGSSTRSTVVAKAERGLAAAFTAPRSPRRTNVAPRRWVAVRHDSFAQCSPHRRAHFRSL